MKLALLVVGSCSFVLGACPSPHLVPLIGEDPEIARIIPPESADDPNQSPLAAARRLHQAFVQEDADTVWSLLAEPTRRALDERGALISASGRELIDASTLPGASGTVRKVRFDTIFFGEHLVDLREGAGDASRAVIVAVAENATTLDIAWVHEAAGWRLLKTSF